jgi:hypothetical protein
MNPTTAQLRRRADRVTARRHTAKNATGSAQHTLAEGLLRAVPSARQRRLAVDCYEHVD